jgi:hypothetical protein
MKTIFSASNHWKPGYIADASRTNSSFLERITLVIQDHKLRVFDCFVCPRLSESLKTVTFSIFSERRSALKTTRMSAIHHPVFSGGEY